MSRLIWTPGASEGLERAYLFLEKENEDSAVKALDAMDNGLLLLEKFPEAGRPAMDLEPEHRELLIPFGGSSGYVLLHRIEDNLVYILAVRHQKESGYWSR
ncbi:MAG: type II toxin-antitoxin system RelE/ParE family toxin [Desulfovibrio sp.]|jgi:toxin ParE1/3/4|nr:type II toxin-antitoxin system RelE/ParE family toxin [Desulfovibrio sp.]